MKILETVVSDDYIQIELDEIVRENTNFPVPSCLINTKVYHIEYNVNFGDHTTKVAFFTSPSYRHRAYNNAVGMSKNGYTGTNLKPLGGK